MKWLWKNKYFIVGVMIFVILTGGVIKKTGIERERFSRVEQIFSTVFRPVGNVLTDTTETVKNTFSSIYNLVYTYKENRLLKQKVQDYEALSHRLNEAQIENRELRDMLDLESQNENFDLMTAEIINRSTTNWRGTFMINKGTKDGIKKDMTVISPRLELVGRVFSTGDHYAVVLPLIDQYSRVGGRVEETRETGVVKGVASNTANQCVMERLPRDAKVKKGQTVITSGLGIFPKGIIIGKVSSVKSGEHGISKEATITPYTNFNKLEKVFLIKRVLVELPEIPSPEETEQLSEEQ